MADSLPLPYVTTGFGQVTITGWQNSMTVSSYITTVVCIYHNQQPISVHFGCTESGGTTVEVPNVSSNRFVADNICWCCQVTSV